MRLIMQFLIIFTFAMNAFVVQASTMPCSHMKNDTAKMEMTEPCQDMAGATDQNTDDSTNIQDCDGVCLCSYMSSPALTLPELQNVHGVFSPTQTIEKSADDNLLSFATAPPHQPPK